MLKVATVLILLLYAARAAAQAGSRLDGSVVDSAGRALPGIELRLFSGPDTLRAGSNPEGWYRFDDVRAGNYFLAALYNGTVLQTIRYSLRLPLRPADTVPRIVVPVLPEALAEVIVRPPPVTLMEDTVQFNAGAFRMREGATVEELIRKFPGMTVDRDGAITAQGKQIVKVRVNGKDFFAGDIRAATQNLPADIVRNIQIIDDYGDQANLTGVRTDEPQKIININTRKDRNRGTFGTVLAGVGTEGRYLATVSLNRFRDNQQLSLVASANNTSVNVNAFNGQGRSSGASQASSSPGITTTYSLAMNYRDKWSEKLTVYGSYSLSAYDNLIESLSFQQDLNPQDTRITNRSNVSTGTGASHRLAWNMEYAFSPKSLLKLAVNGSYAGTRNQSDAVSTISRRRFYASTRNGTDAETRNADFGGSLLFNHRFDKKGRNLNVNAGFDLGRSQQENRVENRLTDVDSAGADTSYTQPLIVTRDLRQRQETANRREKSRLALSYTEPLFEAVVAELSYSLSYEEGVNRRDVFDRGAVPGSELLNPDQSNDFQSTFLISRYGLNIQSNQKKYNYLLGVVMQPSELRGNNRTRRLETYSSNTNWAPIGRLTYRFASQQSLTVSYNGQYREPDFQKLQPVVDSTNPSNIVVGNPGLRPEFSNRVTASFNASDRERGSVLFASLSYDKTLNRVVNSVFNDPRSTSRTTTYVNDDGFYNVSGNATVSRPFSARRYTLSAGLSAGYDNSVSFTDFQRGLGKTWRLQPNVKLQVDIADRLDAELGAQYALNRTEAVYQSRVTRTDTKVFMLALSGRYVMFRDLAFGWDYSKQLNSGYGGATNFSPDILNLYLEYRFLKAKAATVRLQGFDLLNQNERISRAVNGTTITDNRFNGLRRYLILSFGWRLSRFDA